MKKQITVEITEEVVAVLRRCEFTPTTVKLPNEQLDRKLYEAVNKVLSAQGGKWNRKLGAHVFPAHVDPQAMFGAALVAGKVVHEKKTFQAFYTPPDLAERLVELLGVHTGAFVLEPSAGDGALVDAVMRGRTVQVTAVEANPMSAERLRMKYGENQAVEIYEGDFLEKQPVNLGTFEFILMNPPFTGGQDLEHVTHALKFLRPGGRLVSVMPASISFGESKKHKQFREMLDRDMKTWFTQELPAESFTSSGTNVNTCVLVVQARSES